MVSLRSSRCQLDVEKLPPTLEALKYKVFRSNFVTMVWKRCHLSHQNFPFTGAYGWEVDDEESFYPNLTNNLPVPLAILEISSCGCKTALIIVVVVRKTNWFALIYASVRTVKILIIVMLVNSLMFEMNMVRNNLFLYYLSVLHLA